jgi:hypothetical protein
LCQKKKRGSYNCVVKPSQMAVVIKAWFSCSVCCDYDYFRFEADLLMKLQKYEGTSNKLENLLQTKHVRQGSPSLAREARQWLQKCYMQVEGANEEEIQRALEYSLTIDDHQ